MAMIQLEGFEGYAQTGDNSSGGSSNGGQWEGNVYASSPQYVDHDARGVAKRFGGYNSSQQKYIHSLIFSAASCTVGASVNTPNNSTIDNITYLGLQIDRTDQARTSNLFTRVITSGGNWALRCEPTAQVFGSGIPVLNNTWTYLESQVVLTSATTADISLRINGVTVVNQSVAAGGTAVRRMSFELTGFSGSTSIFVDDVYICDEAQFYGPLAIKRVPLVQASYQTLAPYGGLNALDCIDEESCDLDASYVASAIPAAKQTMTAVFEEPPMFIVLSSMTRSEALSSTSQRFIDGPDGAYREHGAAFYQETYENKPVILSTLYDGSPLSQAGANAQEYGFEIVNG